MTLTKLIWKNSIRYSLSAVVQNSGMIHSSGAFHVFTVLKAALGLFQGLKHAQRGGAEGA